MSWSFHQLQINTQNTKSLKKKKMTFRRNTLKGNPLVFFSFVFYFLRAVLERGLKGVGTRRIVERKARNQVKDSCAVEFNSSCCLSWNILYSLHLF